VLPTPNFEEILNDGSDANKYMEYKIKNFARRYDTIRFDVGWAYVQPRLMKNGEDNVVRKPYFGDEILNKIEGWVKEVKGDDFDPKNLIWEFEAGPGDFEWCKDNKVIPPLADRVKVYSATYMSNDWGSNEAFLKRDFGADNFVIGVGNHDPQPLRQIAEGIKEKVKENGTIRYNDNRTNAVEPLARILNLDKNSLSNPVEFAKAIFDRQARNYFRYGRNAYRFDAVLDELDRRGPYQIFLVRRIYVRKIQHGYKAEGARF